MVSATVNRDAVSPVKSPETEVHLSAPGGKTSVEITDPLPDISMCNQQLQTSGSLACKKTFGDKDLLLLHAVKVSNEVKARSGDHLKFADSLTHIFLFLFPYHFFW